MTTTPPVTCPSCRRSMTALSLDGHYGTRIELDLCAACHGIWFDERENLRLTPGATLQLFERIHDAERETRRALGERMQCPRCDMRLTLTHDRQRDTPFRYWRCPRRHGRFTTFFDFLREKDFIRPLSAAQIDELRTHVRSVNCSNCGAPIDLQVTSVCGYCRTPLSMLDFAQVERTIAALGEAEAKRAEAERKAQADPMLPLSLLRERLHVERLFGEAGYRWGSNVSVWPASGLVEAGISALVGWLKRR
ncbi:MAG TPA: zf-TFIIB domain-containing protein [Vicinamibacterales bacterium]